MISHYPPREQGKTFFEQNHEVIKLLDEEPREKATVHGLFLWLGGAILEFATVSLM